MDDKDREILRKLEEITEKIFADISAGLDIEETPKAEPEVIGVLYQDEIEAFISIDERAAAHARAVDKIIAEKNYLKSRVEVFWHEIRTRHKIEADEIAIEKDGWKILKK